LACPLFHHEIVKRAVVLALDKKEEGERQAISSLLAFLFADEVGREGGREGGRGKRVRFKFCSVVI